MTRITHFGNTVENAGEFGLFQKLIFVLLSLMAIPCAMVTLNYAFTAATPNFQCLQNVYEQRNITYSANETAFVHVSSDKVVNFNAESKTRDQCVEASSNVTPDGYHFQDERRPCSTWIFDKSQYTNTIATEWGLVCDDSWLLPTSQAVDMGGSAAGGIVSGFLSDRYGRRIVLVVSIVIIAATSIAESFSPTYAVLVILRFPGGIFKNVVWMTSYVMILEFTGTSWRSVVGVGIQFFHVTGVVCLALLAYLVRDWRYLQLYCSLPFSVLAVLYCCFVVESPHWLLMKGRYRQANKILHKIARVNRLRFSKNFNFVAELEGFNENQTACDVIHSVETCTGDKAVDHAIDNCNSLHDTSQKKDNESKNASPLTRLVSSRKLLFRLLVLWYIWTTITFIFYGLSLYSADLSGDDYINFALSGVVEIPAYLLAAVLSKTWSHRLPLAISLLLCGIFMLCCAAFPPESIGITVLALAAKLTASVAIAIVYTLTVHIFPTEVRGFGVGTCGAISRLGGITAPYVLLMSKISISLPLLVFGVAALSVGFLTMTLPETFNLPLPDSFSDAEAQVVSSIIPCRNKRQKMRNGHCRKQDEGTMKHIFEECRVD